MLSPSPGCQVEMRAPTESPRTPCLGSQYTTCVQEKRKKLYEEIDKCVLGIFFLLMKTANRGIFFHSSPWGPVNGSKPWKIGKEASSSISQGNDHVFNDDSGHISVKLWRIIKENVCCISLGEGYNSLSKWVSWPGRAYPVIVIGKWVIKAWSGHGD